MLAVLHYVIFLCLHFSGPWSTKDKIRFLKTYKRIRLEGPKEGLWRRVADAYGPGDREANQLREKFRSEKALYVRHTTTKSGQEGGSGLPKPEHWDTLKDVMETFPEIQPKFVLDGKTRIGKNLSELV